MAANRMPAAEVQVSAGLVRRLQGQVRELRETIQGINRLAADLRTYDAGAGRAGRA